LNAEQDARAFAEDPKNIEKLILIRDSDDHDGSLRLKAIELIRVKPPQHSITKDEFKAIRKQAQAIGASPGPSLADRFCRRRPSPAVASSPSPDTGASPTPRQHGL
jgi:hypothetical protein